jgi:hypothetical protein
MGLPAWPAASPAKRQRSKRIHREQDATPFGQGDNLGESPDY